MTTTDIFELAHGGAEASGRGVHGESPSSSHLEGLSREECIRRLQAHGVGRVSVVRVDRPAIYPVNYVINGESIVFRTRRGSDLYATTYDAPAAFEIDGTDAIYHEGWSVLVVGRASHVHDPREIARLSAARLTAWAGARRDCFVKIELEEVTGRHIHHRAPTTTADIATG
jgi:nitroimidazol reductase NimA-like FMN-containing flavoprotein (pyridoxamine 5'-phosphate oxidase superfamily)